jgi:hypothetical protein
LFIFQNIKSKIIFISQNLLKFRCSFFLSCKLNIKTRQSFANISNLADNHVQWSWEYLCSKVIIGCLVFWEIVLRFLFNRSWFWSLFFHLYILFLLHLCHNFFNTFYLFLCGCNFFRSFLLFLDDFSFGCSFIFTCWKFLLFKAFWFNFNP